MHGWDSTVVLPLMTLLCYLSQGYCAGKTRSIVLFPYTVITCTLKGITG